MPNNWKCRMSCRVDTQAHSVAPTFTRRQVEGNFNMPLSLLVRKQRSPAPDKGCRIDIVTHLAAPFSTSLFLSGGGRLVVHVDSVEGDLLASQTDTLDELHDAV